MSALVGRDLFAKVVAEAHHQILEDSKAAADQRKKGNPQWRKYGLKLLEPLEPLKQALQQETGRPAMEDHSRGSTKTGRKGKQDVGSSSGKKGGKATMPQKKNSAQTNLKWQDLVPSKGYGASVSMYQKGRPGCSADS